MTDRGRRSLVAIVIAWMTTAVLAGCSPGGAAAGPRSWLATEPGTVVFLTVAIDGAGTATGSFSLDFHAGGSAGIPVLDLSEHYNVSGTGDASGLVLRLVGDAGATGSATATYRGSDLDLAATLADGAREAWLLHPATAADFDAAVRALRSPDVTSGATCASPGHGFLHQVVQQSMERTLVPGDTVLVVWRDSLARGDIVVFEPPEAWVEGGPKTPFIKRVIALGGQTVDISAGSVRVDGIPLDEPYVYDGQPTSASDEPAHWVVPDGQVFVLGDHRAASADSRAFGPIAVSSVLGVAVRRCLPSEAPLP
ncbi:MAG TPA: signal peptidase I [Patescibacteria group bacterium]|nr:signal peptidase I [Patescibacteria group bacterium]